MTIKSRPLALFALMLSLTVLTACASSRATAQSNVDAGSIDDPFEGYNRAIFAFNDVVDENILVPVVKGYRAVVPKPVRTGVHNVLTNLRSPITIGNQLLQGDLEGAGDATVRMVVNSLIGVGGIFDVAAMEGIEHEHEDFGQTLAVWGVGHGPYIVPPLLPPGSLRDQTGMVVDMVADPVGLWMGNTEREALMYTRMGLGIIDQRDGLLDVLADLKKSSIDYYATVRSAYVQRRAALVSDQKADSTGGADIPNYSAGEQ